MKRPPRIRIRVRRRTLLLRTGVLSAALTVLTAHASLAFRIFQPEIHYWITEWNVSAQPKTLAYLCEQNQDTDHKFESYKPAHFDSEEMPLGAQFIVDNLNQGLDDLGAGYKKTALKYFGRAMHTLQDFYSHSNWVENNLTPTSDVYDIPICSNLIYLDGNGTFVVGSVQANADLVTNGSPALVCTPSPGAPLTPPLSYMTSGYYPSAYGAPKCTHTNMNKDYNSVSFALPEKYKNYRGHEPGPVKAQPLHEYARFVAGTHTAALWDQIQEALQRRYGARGPGLVKYLTEDQAQMTWVVDASTSMTGYMPKLKTAIKNAAAGMTTISSKPLFRLATFDDAGNTGLSTTLDLSELQGWVNGITPGGGDGHEPVLATLDYVVDRTDRAHFITFVTDSVTGENAALERRIIDKARRKGIGISCVLMGFSGFYCGCSYERIALATGGQIYRWVSTSLASSESPEHLGGGPGKPTIFAAPPIDSAFAQIGEHSRPDVSCLAFVERIGSSSPADVIPVVADDSLGFLNLDLSHPPGNSMSLTVRRPGGAVVTGSDPDAQLLDSFGLHRVVIIHPAAGDWSMTVTGFGSYTATAYGGGPRKIAAVDVYRWLESTGPHLLTDPVDGVVALEDTVRVRFALTRWLDNPIFEAVSLDGTVLATLPGEPDDGPNLALPLYNATFQPHAASDGFVMRVRGQIGATTVQRVYPFPLTVTTLEVRPTGGTVAVPPGCAALQGIRIANRGTAGTFRIKAHSVSGWTVTPDSLDVLLGSGEADTVTFSVAAPLINGETVDSLDVTATGVTDPTLVVGTTASTMVAQDCGIFCVDCNHNLQNDACDISSGVSNDANGNQIPDECEVTGVDPLSAIGPRWLSARPNPFRKTTVLQFVLDRSASVRIDVIDASGRRMVTAMRGTLGVGPHEWTWDGTDDGGRVLPSALYMVRLTAHDRTAFTKVWLRR